MRHYMNASLIYEHLEFMTFCLKAKKNWTNLNRPFLLACTIYSLKCRMRVTLEGSHHLLPGQGVCKWNRSDDGLHDGFHCLRHLFGFLLLFLMLIVSSYSPWYLLGHHVVEDYLGLEASDSSSAVTLWLLVSDLLCCSVPITRWSQWFLSAPK